jgi:hypothetical protein
MTRALLAATGTSLSGGDLLLTFVLWSLFALLGYRISLRHQVLRGVTPWRFPSVVWAVICFAFGPIGLVVELFAEFTTKPRLPSSLSRIAFRDASARVGAGLSRSGGQQGTTGQTSRAAATDPPIVIPEEPIVVGPSPPDDGSGKTAAFGWYGDPTDRHELRYFDGRRWSDFVSDADVRSVDPLEPDPLQLDPDPDPGESP